MSKEIGKLFWTDKTHPPRAHLSLFLAVSQNCLKEYQQLLSQQPFTKANCNERVLRLWVKAFLELMPTIVNEYKDSELVDLVLFKLPWLCYGLK